MPDNNITIREGDEFDKKTILKIANGLSDWFEEDALVRAIPTDLNFHKSIIAEFGGKPIGFLTYSSYEGSVFISWLGVEKQLQGSGAGTKLVRYLENKLLDLNIKKLKVETLSDAIEYEPYVKTRAFYEKMGFEKGESKAITNPKGEKLELVTYHKDLK